MWPKTKLSMILYCSDFERAGLWDTHKCCSSCHRDYEEGYVDFLSECYPPAKDGTVWSRNNSTFASVCCTLSHELGEMKRLTFAKVLLATRRVKK